MTAINIIRQRAAIHTISDAAVYDEAGVLHHHMSKVTLVPALPAIVGMRGGIHLQTAIGHGTEFTILLQTCGDAKPRQLGAQSV